MDLQPSRIGQRAPRPTVRVSAPIRFSPVFHTSGRRSAVCALLVSVALVFAGCSSAGSAARAVAPGIASCSLGPTLLPRLSGDQSVHLASDGKHLIVQLSFPSLARLTTPYVVGVTLFLYPGGTTNEPTTPTYRIDWNLVQNASASSSVSLTWNTSVEYQHLPVMLVNSGVLDYNPAYNVTAEISTKRLSHLDGSFHWRASLVVGSAAVSAVSACPTHFDATALLFPQRPLPPVARHIPAVKSVVAAAYAIPAGCPPAACEYDNGIDFEQLADAVSGSLGGQVHGVVNVNCDRPNPSPPNTYDVGQTFLCSVSDGYIETGTVEVLVTDTAPYYSWSFLGWTIDPNGLVPGPPAPATSKPEATARDSERLNQGSSLVASAGTVL
jgi:hypothetical protein